MGSVQSLERCPKCGGYMAADYYYHTGEEYRRCYRCGFSQSWSLERDENGLAKRDESGRLAGVYSESVGYGAAYIEYNGGQGAHYFFTEPVSEQVKNDFMKYIKENSAEAKSYLVAFDPHTKELIRIFGEMPPDFDKSEGEDKC